MASFGDAPPGDLKAGEKIFKTKCSQCHVVEKGGGHKQVCMASRSVHLCTSSDFLSDVAQGPNLGGLFGRVSGTTPGFAYSKANKEKAIVWSDETLYDYLLAPKKYIPGTYAAGSRVASCDMHRCHRKSYLHKLHPFISLWARPYSTCLLCACVGWRVSAHVDLTVPPP